MNCGWGGVVCEEWWGLGDGVIVGFVVWVWVQARAQPNDDVDKIVSFIIINGLRVTGTVCTWD